MYVNGIDDKDTMLKVYMCNPRFWTGSVPGPWVLRVTMV